MRSVDPAWWGTRVCVIRGNQFSGVFLLRNVAVLGLLAVAAVALGYAALIIGEVTTTPAQVWDGLRGTGDAVINKVVGEWRFPRAMAALLLGAALGVSGAIFQTITRNPLGSPDIVGLTVGSYAGASLVMVFVATPTFFQVAGGSIAGGIATAAVVLWLAWSVHGLSGFRLIIAGIGLSSMLGAIVTWLLSSIEVEDAMMVAIWGAGSLRALTADQVWPAAVAVALCLAGIAAMARHVGALECGDQLAHAWGAPTNLARGLLIVLAVVLVAICSAVTGPISFVALVAPHIARSLLTRAATPLMGSALVGGILLLGSDLIATNIYPPSPLPVGVITTVLGGGYFALLLIRMRP